MEVELPAFFFSFFLKPHHLLLCFFLSSFRLNHTVKSLQIISPLYCPQHAVVWGPELLLMCHRVIFVLWDYWAKKQNSTCSILSPRCRMQPTVDLNDKKCLLTASQEKMAKTLQRLEQVSLLIPAGFTVTAPVDIVLRETVLRSFCFLFFFFFFPFNFNILDCLLYGSGSRSSDLI